MESVGSPPRAAQVSKTAPQNSGPEAAGKTPEARREVKAAPSKNPAAQDLAAAAPPDGSARGAGGVSQPTPGHGLGQRVDIRV